MYHQQSDMLCSQAMMNYSELLNHNGLDLNFDRQFGLEAKQDAGMHLVQDGCYPPGFFPSPSMFSLPLPRNPCPSLSVFAGESTSVASTNLYESPPNLELPDQAAILRDVFNSLPRNYGFFHGNDGGNGRGSFGADLSEELHGGQLEGRGMDTKQKKKKKRSSTGLATKGSFKTERQRRERFSKKYEILKALIPNPTKPDRATIVADTIDYIHELQRTINEIKIILDKKQRRREKRNNVAVDNQVAGDMESSSMKPVIDDGEGELKGILRSSWLQRKSKQTFVDVRIVEDEVYIKITQPKKSNCLLIASKVLNELQLEFLHVSGGIIGNCHSFMFNSKIHEGSSVYAGAIANKLIEAMDQY